MTTSSKLMQAPIFLVGSERSGTTLLRLMLDHHPKITWCPEFEYTVDKIKSNGQFPPLDEYHQWLEIQRTFLNRNLKIDKNLNYCELVNNFLEQEQARRGKPIIGATVHRHFDRILLIWPNARFIHIVRDPRDVAPSCIQMGWAGNVWTGVNFWQKDEELWENLQDKIPKKDIIEVRYESLIADPVKNLTDICEFIGVTFDEAMFTYAEKTTYDLPNAKYIQQWKKKLSEYEIRLIESKVGKLLEKRGYQLSGLPPLEVNPIIELQLKYQDWWKRFQHRVNRFGLGLFIAEFFSRRLKLKTWHKQIRIKMNEIDKSLVK